MSFSAPPSPSPPPPPPPPPLLANSDVQMAGERARRAAAAASGSGFAGTIKTSPQGADDPSTTGGADRLSGTAGGGKAKLGE